MTSTKAKAAAVLCGLSMAGAALFSGGMLSLDTNHVAAGSLQATPASGQQQPAISLEKALETARGAAKGDVTEIELDHEDGVLVWEIEVGTSKVYINANDGSVIQVKEKAQKESTLAQPKITLEKAMEIAKGEAQGDITKLELDDEDGVLVWEIEIGGSEVQIDANDGSVVQVQTHDSDHNGDDHDDDDHDDD